MRPPCEIVQRDFLRVLRASVAKSLSEEGLSQTDIAVKMNLTQAAVSKYLSEPLPDSRLSGEISTLKDTLTGMLKAGESSDALIREICSTCMQSRISSTMCEMHQTKVPSLKAAHCQVCSELLGGRDDNLAERAKVISDMQDGLRIIERSNTFYKIVPQVRANLVVCNNAAKTVNDVAGVPGRITIVDGQARALISPQYGASKHTAEILLHIRKTWKRIHSCLCVSGKDEVVHSARKVGFKIVSIPTPENATSGIIMSFDSIKSMSGPRTSFPAIHVPGGIGVEPILYLFGPSAIELSRLSLELCDSLSE
ncbi:MAG: thiamine-phosphate synthase family protein [Promethearchaeota archaeon]